MFAAGTISFKLLSSLTNCFLILNFQAKRRGTIFILRFIYGKVRDHGIFDSDIRNASFEPCEISVTAINGFYKD